MSAQPWKIRLSGDVLTIIERATFEEYSRKIDNELCSTCGGPPHTLFAFPQAIAIIGEIVNLANDGRSDAHLVIERNKSTSAIVTATFTAATQINIGTSHVSHSDQLIVDCQIVPRDESARQISQLKAEIEEVIMPIISDLRAVNCALAQRIVSMERAHSKVAEQLNVTSAMLQVCRQFGTIPAQLWDFGEEVMRAELRSAQECAREELVTSKSAPVRERLVVSKCGREGARECGRECGRAYVFPAMSNAAIWLSTGRAVNIAKFMEQEPIIEVSGQVAVPLIAKEKRHWTSLLWVRAVVRVFESNDPLWSSFLAHVESRRVVIAQSMLHSLALVGARGKTLALNPSVRSVVLSCSERTALNPTDITNIWVSLSKIIADPNIEEIIIPQRISSMIPPSIISRSVIKSAHDTTKSEIEPLAWCSESIATYLRDETFFTHECLDLIPESTRE